MIIMDRERIKELVEVLENSAAAEISCREGDAFIRIRRSSGTGRLRADGDTEAVVAEPSPAQKTSDDQPTAVAVTSQFVGTFHLQPKDGSQPIVESGQHVSEGDVVGAIEALNKWTELLSPVTGQIAEIMAEEDDPVQYGDVVMRINPQEANQIGE